MTVRTNARLAGVTFLVYIAAGLSSMAGAPGREILGLLMSFSALVLGVTLYAITSGEDRDLALLAMLCRVLEAMSGDPGTGAIYFAVGSTIFSWLLLRGGMIPSPLAWLGIVASALLVVVLPAQRAGLLGGDTGWASSLTWMIWLPMLVFELAIAAWLITKGVAEGRGRDSFSRQILT